MPTSSRYPYVIRDRRASLATLIATKGSIRCAGTADDTARAIFIAMTHTKCTMTIQRRSSQNNKYRFLFGISAVEKKINFLVDILRLGA
jgi:hypothetical protein